MRSFPTKAKIPSLYTDLTDQTMDPHKVLFISADLIDMIVCKGIVFIGGAIDEGDILGIGKRNEILQIAGIQDANLIDDTVKAELLIFPGGAILEDAQQGDVDHGLDQNICPI